MEQTHIEIGAQERVIYCPTLSSHRIFIGTKLRESFIEKMIELLKGCFTSCAPGCIWSISIDRQLSISDLLQNFLINLIARMFKVWRPLMFTFWGRQAIIGIVIPAPTNWICALHQDIEALSLCAIEVLHDKALLRTCPLRKERAGS